MWNERLGEIRIMVLPRERFSEPLPLPAGFSFVDEIPRAAERELLEAEFEQWRIPYERRFPGARDDSLVAIARGSQIVSVSYVADVNEIGLAGYGEGHYPVVRPELRGLGLFRPRFARICQLAASWGLSGIVVAPSREGLPELYERLGAIPVGTLRPARRARRLLHPIVNPHRSLARRAEGLLREIR
ncbi:MAG: hypothetical protein ACR2N5_05120 [Solirubrobacterales bacterium]